MTHLRKIKKKKKIIIINHWCALYLFGMWHLFTAVQWKVVTNGSWQYKNLWDILTLKQHITDLKVRAAVCVLHIEQVSACTPLHLFLYISFGHPPVQSWSTWIARDSVNCRYLMAFLCAGVETLQEVFAQSIAWLELGMKTQRHCFQWSNPLYSNSTAFLSHIPKPPLLCEGFFFFFLLRKKKEKESYTFLSGSLYSPSSLLKTYCPSLSP